MHKRNIGCVSCNRDVPIRLSLSLKKADEDRIVFISFYDSMRLYNLISLIQKYSLDILLVQKEHFLITDTIKCLDIELIDRSEYRENLDINIDYFSNCAVSSLMSYLKLTDVQIVQEYLDNRCYVINDSKDNVYDLINFTSTKYGQRKLKLDLIHPLINLNEIKSRHEKLHIFRNNGLIAMALEKQLKLIPDIEKTINSCDNYIDDLKNSKKMISQAIKIFNFLDAYKSLKEKSELFCLDITTLKEIFMDLFDPEFSDKSQIHKLFNQSKSEYLNLAVKIYKETIENAEEYLKDLLSILDFKVSKNSNQTVSLKVNKNLINSNSKHQSSVQASETENCGFNKSKDSFNGSEIIGFSINSGSTVKRAKKETYLPNWLIILAIKDDYVLATTLELQNFNYKIQEAYDQIIEIGGEFCKKCIINCKLNKELFNNLFEEISEIDVCLSIYKFSLKYDCCIPSIEENLCIVSSYHPMINKDRVIYNDIYLCDLIRYNILTGSNMSGKSAYMKQLMFHCLLNQIGYPITAKNATMKIFKKIVFKTNNVTSSYDIFSFLDKFDVNSETLVLIDELGKGVRCQTLTLMYLTISKILLMKKAFCILITHHTDFIKFVRNQEGVNTLQSNNYKVTFGLNQSSREIASKMKEMLNISIDQFDIVLTEDTSSAIIKLAIEIQQCKTSNDKIQIIDKIRTKYLNKYQ